MKMEPEGASVFTDFLLLKDSAAAVQTQRAETRRGRRKLNIILGC